MEISVKSPSSLRRFKYETYFNLTQHLKNVMLTVWDAEKQWYELQQLKI